MKIDTMPKKILAGATAIVALSGFVPAIGSVNAAALTATANVGVSVVIQQAITINVGAPINFGTVILINSIVAGKAAMWEGEYTSLQTSGSLVGEISFVGGYTHGRMTINSSAGAVNIAMGAALTYDSGNISFNIFRVGEGVADWPIFMYANNNEDVTLTNNTLSLSSNLIFNAKPTPGTYNTKSFVVTVTDI